MASTPSFIATPKTPIMSHGNADGTAFKTIITGGANGTRIDSIFGTNSDPGVATVMQFAVQVSGVDYTIGEVTIPAGAGTNGTAKSVAVLNTTDIPGLAYTEGNALFLASGAALRSRPKVAVAGAYIINLIGVAGDY